MFQIDMMSRVPVYEQIVRQAECFILMDVLGPGEKMPSVRSLSIQLSINPNTIQKAYTELDRQGMVTSVPGRGVFVAEGAKEILAKTKMGRMEDLKSLLQELKMAGISLDAIRECVKGVYGANDGKTDGRAGIEL